jgi:hypothetical protein
MIPFVDGEQVSDVIDVDLAEVQPTRFFLVAGVPVTVRPYRF